MLRFTSFIMEAKSSGVGYRIDPKSKHVVIDPVHFRYGHKRHVVENAEFDPIAFSKMVRQKRELDDSTSNHLHALQDKPTAAEKAHIKLYTKGTKIVGSKNASSSINRKLLKNHADGVEPTAGMDDKEKEIHATLSKLASKPLKKKVTLYSGVDFDPSEAANKSSGGILHCPAHISATHSKNVAETFALNKQAFTPGSDGRRHIIRIDTKPADKGYHIHNYSAKKDEYETIIPANTKLKYSHSTVERDDLADNEFHVHHFTIHSQG